MSVQIRFQQMSAPDFITDPRGLISVSVPDLSDCETPGSPSEEELSAEVDSIMFSIKQAIEYAEISDSAYAAIKKGDPNHQLRDAAIEALAYLAGHMESLDTQDWQYEDVNFYFSISE